MRILLKRLWEKEKMLATHIFSFSHNVFFHSKNKFHFLYHCFVLPIFTVALSQQPCINATSNLVWCFGKGSCMSLSEFRSASYLLPFSRLGSFSDTTSQGYTQRGKNSKISCSATFILLSANAFNLDQYKKNTVVW